jgi:hypothetical protein
MLEDLLKWKEVDKGEKKEWMKENDRTCVSIRNGSVFIYTHNDQIENNEWKTMWLVCEVRQVCYNPLNFHSHRGLTLWF